MRHDTLTLVTFLLYYPYRPEGLKTYFITNQTQYSKVSFFFVLPSHIIRGWYTIPKVLKFLVKVLKEEKRLYFLGYQNFSFVVTLVEKKKSFENSNFICDSFYSVSFYGNVSSRLNSYRY